MDLTFSKTMRMGTINRRNTANDMMDGYELSRKTNAIHDLVLQIEKNNGNESFGFVNERRNKYFKK